MNVIAEKTGAWILCQQNDSYFLSVMVQVTGAAWDIIFQLNEDEVADYLAHGDAAIDKIDRRCQQHLRAFSERQVDGAISAEIRNAIQQYRQQAAVRAARATFEGITPAAIIAYAHEIDADHLFTKKPHQAYRSVYQNGQTIILQGRKDSYAHLIEFWLACQSWYDDEDVIFNDYGNDDAWMNDENRVGMCLPLDAGTQRRIETQIRAIIPNLQTISYLLMNPTWYDEKVLFLSGEHYYLWYWWTGE